MTIDGPAITTEGERVVARNAPVSPETALHLREAFGHVLTQINALCGVHAWRYYALPKSFTRHDVFAQPDALKGLTVPGYTQEEGVHWREWDTHALRLMDRDASHHLFLIAHNQLFTRPLVKVLTHLVEARSDIVPTRWKGFVRALQRQTEQMVTEGLETASLQEAKALVPLKKLGRLKGNEFGITTESDALYLLDQVRQAQVGLERMLSLPIAQQLMGQTLEDIPLFGYFEDMRDPMGYLNGAAIKEFAGKYPQWMATTEPSSENAARQLRLMAASLRRLYDVQEPMEKSAIPREIGVKGMAIGIQLAIPPEKQEQSGSRFAFCAADPTRSIAAIKEKRTVTYKGPLRPREAVEGLERLAARWESEPDWECIQVHYGTHDLGGSRPMEAYMQAIRPLTNAKTLFQHAGAEGYISTAPETLEKMLDNLIGKRPAERLQSRPAMVC